jgi:glycosyltransferase involved in cell wall biosynthesis
MAEGWINPRFEEGLVSVIIPCYNQERFLPACLASVIDQDYRPLEVVIVDDGSSDGTGRIMNDFQNIRRAGVLVKCIHQAKYGAAHARNQGCSQAQGEFIQFLDGDDLLCRGKLSKQVEVLKNEADVDVVYGDGQYLIDFNESARKGPVISLGSCSDVVETLLNFERWIPIFSCLSRRSAIQLCGPWDHQLPTYEDPEYWLRMAIKGKRFRYKAGINGLYRKHSRNTGPESEKSLLIREKTRRRILTLAEHLLRTRGALNEQRIRTMAESHEGIARLVYPADVECFENSLRDILRLWPKFRPRSRKARFVSSMIGLRNFEKLAARTIHIIYKNKHDWF